MAVINQDIILMGLRGSGKSTVGSLLAQRLGRAFVDLDDCTLARLRRDHNVETIAEVFQRLGEPAFREAESHALREVLDRVDGKPLVVALGGGTPTAPYAADTLRASGGVVVYLRLMPSELTERLRDEIDHRRPALTSAGDPVSEIEEVFQRRDPLYASLAHITVGYAGVAETVDGITKQIAALG